MKKEAAWLLALMLLPLGTVFGQKRTFTIEDLYRVKGVSEMNLAPDGKSLLYTLTTSDLSRAKRASHIWMTGIDGRNPRQLTRSEKGESSARISPDGSTIVFVSAREGSSNLYLMPVRGGEARRLTNISTGVSGPLWSPDGKSVLFATDVYPECGADDSCNRRISERWEKGPLHAHAADHLLYRHWTKWKDGTRTHLFLVSASNGRITDLTPGDFDSPGFQLGGPPQYDFSPDSSEIVYVSNHDKDAASSTNSDLWILPLSGSDARPRDITSSNPAYDGSPKYSPDGRFIAYRMQKQPGYESDLFRLALYDRAGNTSRVLTESYRNWITSFSWSSDSKTIYFTGPSEGRNPIRRFDIATGRTDEVLVDATIDEFELTGDEKTLVYLRWSVADPSELYRVSLTGGAASGKIQLTHANEDLLKEVDVRPVESMWVDGSAGARIQVFIIKPHGFDPGRKYPLILNVHGGPQDEWADAFRGDWQVYPGAGYVVAFANPHGSTGYGQEFTAEISGDWGGEVYQDLMKVADALEKLPYVDGSRMGAMGWSYGGYMMMWMEGHTQRFKAIASMMGLYDLRSFYGATEELWFPEWDLKGEPWNSDLYEKWSPSNFVPNFKTPCLVITGEHDFRVPYTQSLQFFTALQKMNVPSRLIVYSNAGHWPSWYEMALYYTAHLEWFQKYLGGGAPPWTTEQFLRNEVFDSKTGQRIKEQPLKKDEKPEK
jgi:dipeptidyl aminopeptidase/acylaminoacyl peptidase